MLKTKTVFSQRCVKCSRRYEPQFHVITCDCGGLIDFEYDTNDLENWDWIQDDLPGILRYSRLLPLLDPSKCVTIGNESLGPTPLYQSKGLGRFLGLSDLWIKNEIKNFTQSFKARDTVISISRFLEIGINRFVLCSTGNTAAAFCYALSRVSQPMQMHLFLPKRAIIDFDIPRKLVPDVTVIDGPYQKIIEEARSHSLRLNLPYEGGFRNPARREGSKTLRFEIAEAGLEVEWYVQGLATGTGIYGVNKGFSELKKIGAVESSPKMLAVQPEECASIVNAHNANSNSLDPKFIVEDPKTSVTTLANGNPYFSYPYVRNVITSSGGRLEKVSEKEIFESATLLKKHENVNADLAVAVALAGLRKSIAIGGVDRDSTILLNISGGHRDH